MWHVSTKLQCIDTQLIHCINPGNFAILITDEQRSLPPRHVLGIMTIMGEQGWKVITQNMGNGRLEERMEKLQNILEEDRPDVVMLQEPGEFQENIMSRMRSDIKREYVVFSKGLDEQERKEKWKRNGGKVEERIRPSEGVILLLRRDRAMRVREHVMKTKRA